MFGLRVYYSDHNTETACAHAQFVTFEFRDQASRSTAMASGKKSALLSSLADYGDDSEPDSDPEPEESGMSELSFALGDYSSPFKPDQERHAKANVSCS